MLTMEVTPAQVKASVQGSRTKPYRESIETDVLTDSEWDAIEAVMASRAVSAARRLADEIASGDRCGVFGPRRGVCGVKNWYLCPTERARPAKDREIAGSTPAELFRPGVTDP